MESFNGKVVHEIKAEIDEEGSGMKRKRFVFPAGIKNGFDRMNHPSITGAVYIEEGEEVPEMIVIRFKH